MVKYFISVPVKQESRYEHQFQYRDDERFDGENFNFGYVFPVDRDGNLLDRFGDISKFRRISSDPNYIDLGVQEVLVDIEEEV